MTIFGPVPARVNEVHDGDTVYLDIDLGFDHIISAKDFDGHPRLACRVLGINAPELRTPEGDAARDFAKTLLPVGTRVMVTSHGWDKFGGRFDGEITLPNGTDFADLMLGSSHAVPYKP